MKKSLIFLIVFLLEFSNIYAEGKVKRLSDVVYDHRNGVALVFDVLIPEKQNGIDDWFEKIKKTTLSYYHRTASEYHELFSW